MDERNTPIPWQANSTQATAPTLSRASEGGTGICRRAAAVLQARHDVTEMAAYEMLVNEAAAAGTSVREVAIVLLAGSAQTG